MTCNFVNHEAALLEAFESVCNSNDEWTIFEYDGQSNILQVGQSGSSGVEELTQSFNPSKVQYGFVTVEAGGQKKIVLIHWQGESIPAIKLAQTASHLEEVKRFVKKVNMTLHGRNEDDLEISSLKNQFQKLVSLNSPPQLPAKPTPFVPPPPVQTAYQPTKPTELELNEREKFWQELRQEEEERRKEDLDKQQEQQKQYELERKLWEKELHQVSISAAARAAQKAAESQPPPAKAPKPVKKNSLVSGRAQMFDEKVAELVKSNPKTPNKPKQFKYEVALQPKNPPPPINASVNQGDTFVPIVFEDPTKPVAKVNPQQPEVAEQPQQPITEDIKEIQKDPEIISKPNEQSGVLRALTLWDYSADDNTEISFDPNCIITDIEQLYDGWWRGCSPNGQVGLFPSNYVKLL